MTVSDYVRIPVTIEVFSGELGRLAVAFPESGEFYDLLAETIVPLKLTEYELKTAIKDVIRTHSGRLYIADVVTECEYQRLQGLRREDDAKLKRQVAQWKAEWEAEQKAEAEKAAANTTAQSAPDAQKAGKF
jgi:hypothetical protein